MSEDYGWKNHIEESKLEHDWTVLRTNVQNYIKGINFGYKSKLKEIGVDYVNAKARFRDENTIEFHYGSNNQSYELKAKNFVIAAGLRPR